jgi:hypothetical protein
VLSINYANAAYLKKKRFNAAAPLILPKITMPMFGRPLLVTPYVVNSSILAIMDRDHFKTSSVIPLWRKDIKKEGTFVVSRIYHAQST